MDRSPRATTIHPAQPLSTQQCLCILNRPCHACNATSRLDRIQPLLLLRAQPAGWRLDLNAGEHSHSAADHLRRYGHALPADQVSAAFAQAKLHWSAVLVSERAGVISEQARITVAAGDPYFLLDALLAHSHAVTLGQPSLINPLCPTALVAALLR